MSRSSAAMSAVALAAAVSVAAHAGSAKLEGHDRNNLVDEHIFGAMERDGVRPAPLSSDAEFLRRVTLDLTGRLPEVEVVRAFLADEDPAKRDRLVDSLFPALPT